MCVGISGQYGQIRYLAKAYIERPSNLIGKKSTIVTKTAFTVLSGLDLNFIPEAAVSLSNMTNLSFVVTYNHPHYSRDMVRVYSSFLHPTSVT